MKGWLFDISANLFSAVLLMLMLAWLAIPPALFVLLTWLAIHLIQRFGK